MILLIRSIVFFDEAIRRVTDAPKVEGSGVISKIRIKEKPFKRAIDQDYSHFKKRY
jgi:hypothetical protein